MADEATRLRFEEELNDLFFKFKLRTLLEDDIDPRQQQQQLISSFLDIAVGHTEETARKFLEMTNWTVNEAVNLFFLFTSRDSHYELVEAAPSVDDIWTDPKTSRASNNNGPTSEESDSALSSLFRPPSGMLFEGSFEEAKAFSSSKNVWLLVNLQSSTEFACHALNRDVWSNETVMSTVQSNFILLQVYDQTVEGKKVSSFYKIDSVPPVVLLIDPVTGQKMRMWSGKIEAESFVEGLMKFVDAGPQEHIVSLTRNMRLGTEETTFSRNHDKIPPPSWGEEFEQEDACSLNNHTFLSSNNVDKVAAPSWGEEFEQEVAYNNESPSWYEDYEVEEEEEEEEEEETFLEFPDLTEEPKGDCDRSLVCSLCIRFPDGRRKQRKFLKSEAIQLLWSFCYSHMEESDPTAFKLVQAIPGASKTLDYQACATFEQSGLDNCMISVIWE